MSTHKDLPPIEVVSKVMNDNEEKEWLKEYYLQGYPYEDLAKALQRSTMYVKDRIRELVEANQIRARKPRAWRHLKKSTDRQDLKQETGLKTRSGNSAIIGLKTGWKRSSVIAKIDTLEKIKAIATWERIHDKYVTEEAFQLLLDKKKNILARALALHRKRILLSKS